MISYLDQKDSSKPKVEKAEFEEIEDCEEEESTASMER